MDAWTGDRRRPLFFAALAVFAGAAAALAHPPWGVLPGLLGYGMMLWLADRAESRKPLRSAFWRGWLAGCGYFAVSLHWLVYPFYVDAAAQAWMAPIAVVVVVGGIALFWGAALALYRRFAGGGVWRSLLFAGTLAGFEWVRGHILTGFPWDLPGETWSAGSAPSQAASLVGAYGLSWITIAIFAAAGVIAEGRGGKIAAGMAGVALAGLYGFGAPRLTHAPDADAKAPWVRLVQPDVKQEASYDQALFVAILNRYVTLTRRPAARTPDIVVWPEGAIPAALEDYLAPGGWTVRAIARAVAPATALVIGGYRFSGNSSRPAMAYNSLVIARPVGDNLKIVALYDKFRLVPFGEYIPLDSLAGKLGIKELVHVGDGFAHGPRPRPLTPPGVPAVQPLICYEVLFPGFTREGAAASGVRARWIVNVSTDAWFGPGAGPLQHFNIARYRAIEEGLPMARATPTGVSGMIDAFGRVAPGQSLGEGAHGVIDAPFPALPPTPFSRWGDTAFWLMMLVSLAGAIPLSRRGEEAVTRPIRTFGRVKTRTIKPRQAERLETLLPKIAVPEAPFDPRAPMPDAAEAWLEVGFGGGEHLAGRAAARPDVLFLGAEPFLNGVASALRHVEEFSLDNVRLHAGDARDLMARLPASSLDRIYVLFPDPWPKARHHKRRLVAGDFIADAARVLKSGGTLLFATDWNDYANWALVRFLASPHFLWTAKTADDWRRPPPDHVPTRYEAKRLGDCAPLWLAFERR